MLKEEYWFWMCGCEGLWRQDIQILLDHYGEPEFLYQSSAEEVKQITGLGEWKLQNLFELKRTGSFLKKMEEMRKNGIKFLNPDSEDYPEKFRYLKDMPYSLYVKGKLPDPDHPCVGIVGARACSGYGKENGRKISGTLAAENVQVVSGMARGIDSISARGAIENGGKTFAVLGSGIDVIYPAENRDLYYSIIDSGGGIISEYPLGTQPIGWQFPYRNRLIAALSDVLMVIEAAINSGTLTTAAWALELGVGVCAVPGRVGDRLSVGCNRLIADGADIFLNVETLLNSIYSTGKWIRPVAGSFGCTINSAKGDQASPSHPQIYRLLDSVPQNVRQLMEKSGLSAEEVTSALSELEIDGMTIQVSPDYFIKSC